MVARRDTSRANRSVQFLLKVNGPRRRFRVPVSRRRQESWRQADPSMPKPEPKPSALRIPAKDDFFGCGTGVAGEISARRLTAGRGERSF